MKTTAVSRPLPVWHRLLAAAGANFIYALIRIFGRRVSFEEAHWLRGPLGSDYIGDRPYEEVAEQEGLTLTRGLTSGGLLPSFDRLSGPLFDSRRADPNVRHFYENTAEYRMQVWARTWFPANVALWLLVKVLSRKVDQLNFPVDAMETAQGLASEIIDLADAEGRSKYRGWFRRYARDRRVVYTGFYMTEAPPYADGPCVKVVFPMPQGNATVILKPRLDDEGRFTLDSTGRRFGDAGFYRVQSDRRGRLRAWRITTLIERFAVFTDEQGDLRCDHSVRFLWLPVLHLHYRLEPNDSRRPSLIGQSGLAS